MFYIGFIRWNNMQAMLSSHFLLLCIFNPMRQTQWQFKTYIFGPVCSLISWFSEVLILILSVSVVNIRSNRETLVSLVGCSCPCWIAAGRQVAEKSHVSEWMKSSNTDESMNKKETELWWLRCFVIREQSDNAGQKSFKNKQHPCYFRSGIRFNKGGERKD